MRTFALPWIFDLEVAAGGRSGSAFPTHELVEFAETLLGSDWGGGEIRRNGFANRAVAGGGDGILVGGEEDESPALGPSRPAEWQEIP